MEHIDKKRKFGEMEIDLEFPKSEILKQLTLEQQIKYRKLDKYLENITHEELKNYYFNVERVKAVIEPYDRMLFIMFMRNVFHISIY
jgi:hypothetical protein